MRDTTTSHPRYTVHKVVGRHSRALRTFDTKEEAQAFILHRTHQDARNTLRTFFSYEIRRARR